MITKKERNLLKRLIIKEFTKEENGYSSLFDKKTGEANYINVNLEMVMECVFKGLNKHTDKDKK